jgi:hypothetical protein
MITFIEPLYKSKDSILFAWNPEPGAVSYTIYVGTTPVFAAMTSLVAGLHNAVGNNPAAPGKVAYKVTAASVLTALSLSTGDFSANAFYFALVSDNAIAPSRVVLVPPVGIMPPYMKDDPTINRHPYVFSSDLYAWVKAAGSSNGATIIDSADYYKSNITTEYTYDSSNVTSTKSYPSDATSSGSPAKLTTYSYNVLGKVTKIQITDSTV